MSIYLQSVPKLYRMLKYPRIFYHFCVLAPIKFFVYKTTKFNLFLKLAQKRGRACGRDFLSNEQYNEKIKELIKSGKPFFSCRYGTNEFVSAFFGELRKKGVLDNISKEKLRKVKTSSGVFPENENIYVRFGEDYLKSLGNADLNAYLGCFLMEEYIIKNSMKKECNLYTMRAIEPYQFDEPWTYALAGKKVLIVHPFVKLMEEQYSKIDKVYPDRIILPECDIKYVEAVQSSGDTVPDNFTDWHEALLDTYNRCMQEDFDIALVSCGSYAVPLASRLKDAGKQVIVTGGVLQLFFGIKGARWEESRPDIVELYNDNWVRATGKYVVDNAKKMVDGAAYW